MMTEEMQCILLALEDTAWSIEFGQIDHSSAFRNFKEELIRLLKEIESKTND